jgi:hypothetical protein
MKIAIDLNDVLRDYTRNFAKYYKQGKDRTFDMSSLTKLYTNDMFELFPFKSIDEYHRFIYEDYAWELYGKCETRTRSLTSDFKNWVTKTIFDIDIDEPIDVIIVSPMEYGLSVASSYFFLSKLGVPVREVFFPTDASQIWEKCDILVTANPYLLSIKPEGKKSVRIEMEYNEESEYDATYADASEFFSERINIEKLLNNE